jgi:SnoaL-like domain
MTDESKDDHAIRNLAANYSHAVAKLDPVAAAATYAEDGVLSAFFGPEFAGRAQLVEVFTQTFATLDFIVQSCSAGMVELQGDRARASWSVSEWYRNKGQVELGCCFGLYEDQLVRGPAGWRFARRRFHPFYRGSSPSTGKLYKRPEAFVNDYAPWPFFGAGSAPA